MWPSCDRLRMIAFLRCVCKVLGIVFVFFFKQKTAYERRISDWSSDVCSSDLFLRATQQVMQHGVWSGEILQCDRAGRTLEAEGRWTLVRNDRGEPESELGRASCRERVCQYV